MLNLMTAVILIHHYQTGNLKSIHHSGTGLQKTTQWSFFPISSLKPRPNLQDSPTRGTQPPPADRPSGLLKGTIRGSLFRLERPFVSGCGMAPLKRNVISHRLNSPRQRLEGCVQIRSERGMWRRPAVLQWAALLAALQCKRVLMVWGW